MTAFYLAAVLVFAADRLLKHFLEGTEAPFLPGLLRITTVYNTGTAMGLLGDSAPVLLILLGAGLAGFLLWAARTRASSLLSRASLGAIVGGAAGNLWDRALFGHVIDLFDFEFVRFYVFNFADAAIVAGSVLCAVTLLFAEERCWKGKSLGQDHRKDR